MPHPTTHRTLTEKQATGSVSQKKHRALEIKDSATQQKQG